MPRTLKSREEEMELAPENSGSKLRRLSGLLILLAVILGIIYYIDILPINKDAYSAVFLSNGQVYFGKLYHSRSQYPVLRDTYYLQVTQPLQQGESQPNQQQPNVNLIKLGDELHGPQDEMRINRDSILFIEKLKSDSKVVQAINDLKKK